VADRELHITMTTLTLSPICYGVRRTDRSCFSAHVHENGGYFEHIIYDL